MKPIEAMEIRTKAEDLLREKYESLDKLDIVIDVVSLTAELARLRIQLGNIPRIKKLHGSAINPDWAKVVREMVMMAEQALNPEVTDG